MHEEYWQLQEAKNKLSQLISNATHGAPQVITLRGKEVVVVLSVEEYRKLIQPTSELSEFFRSSPFKDVELDLERDKGSARDIEL